MMVHSPVASTSCGVCDESAKAMGVSGPMACMPEPLPDKSTSPLAVRKGLRWHSKRFSTRGSVALNAAQKRARTRRARLGGGSADRMKAGPGELCDAFESKVVRTYVE